MNPNVDRLPAPDVGTPGNATEFGGDFGVLENAIEHEPNKEVVAKSPLIPPAASVATDAATPTQMGPPALQQASTVPAPPASVDQRSSDEQLEREVVSRAKAIIAQTKYDPFLQTQEISKLKIEYQKMQFGREVKTDRV